MKQLQNFGSRGGWRHSLFAGLLVAVAGQIVHASTVSIVNEVFADSNTNISVVCFNGGGSEGPNGLNCNPPGFVLQSNPNVTVAGTMDTTGMATTASEQLNLSSPSGQSATAFGAGNLSTGTVSSLTSGSSGAEGVSTVSIQDNVHFTVAGANSATVTPIQITWTFDGVLSGPFLGFAGAPVAAQSSLQLGGTVSASEDIFGGPPALTSVGASGWVSSTFSSQTASLVQFTGVFDLVGSATTLPLLLSLQTDASNGDMADFSHTSRVGLILPSNVTFTSDSGVLLTSNGTTTPEPSTFFLIGFGVLAVRTSVSAVRRLRRG